MSICKFKAVAGRLVLASLALAILQADQIVLKDGDRITGSIVKKDGQTVTVQSKNFGAVTLKWDDIATVTTDQPLHIVLTGGQAVKAPIQTQDGRIQVGAAGAPRIVDAAQIVTLRNDAEEKAYQRFLRPGLLDLWTINGSVALAGTKGNAVTNVITTPLNFARISNTSRTTRTLTRFVLRPP